MNDSVLVEALRARDPGALAALYDTHAESIYRYARTLLESSDSAQVALRDTLIAAEAHVHALADPERLRVWLYALARGECARRRSALQAMPAGDDTEIGAMAGGASDGELRLVAVNAVAALPEDEREVLDLLARHAIPEHELAAVLGTTAAQAEQLRQAASYRLQDLVTTEILARNASPACAERAQILAGLPGAETFPGTPGEAPGTHGQTFSGEEVSGAADTEDFSREADTEASSNTADTEASSGTADTEAFSRVLDARTRELLLEHTEHCAVCGPHRERQVSAAKVFNLLPVAELPETLRVRVMSCFIDPELVPYRRFVARRTGLLDPHGFPLRETKRARRGPAVLAGAVAALAIVVVAVVLVGAVRDAENPAASGEYAALTVPGPSLTAAPVPSGTRPATPSASLTPVAGGTRDPRAARPMAPVAAIGPHAAAFVPPRVPLPPSPSTRAPKPSRSSSPAPTAKPTPRPPSGEPPTAPPPPTPPRPPRQRPPLPAPTATHQHHPRRTPCPPRTRPAPTATSSPAPTGSGGTSSAAPTGSGGGSSAGVPAVPAIPPQAAGRVHRQ
ncbi:hypothetical protein [Sphaerisporangium dianthi]|uniref:RNA polymerase sigma-70 region 2 domain-containing protein n=1 Tax=Sphaerisporangium dianthi TaxID=1436120 RepID=A0ABV9CMS9_9ACTN